MKGKVKAYWVFQKQTHRKTCYFSKLRRFSKAMKLPLQNEWQNAEKREQQWMTIRGSRATSWEGMSAPGWRKPWPGESGLSRPSRSRGKPTLEHATFSNVCFEDNKANLPACKSSPYLPQLLKFDFVIFSFGSWKAFSLRGSFGGGMPPTIICQDEETFGQG